MGRFLISFALVFGSIVVRVGTTLVFRTRIKSGSVSQVKSSLSFWAFQLACIALERVHCQFVSGNGYPVNYQIQFQ